MNPVEGLLRMTRTPPRECPSPAPDRRAA